MEIKKYQVGKNEFEFACRTWENSRNWGHEVSLCNKGYEIGNHRITYINRTWERYRYQTCMISCVRDLIKQEIETLKESFKIEHNISRLTKKYQNKFDLYLKNSNYLADLYALKNLL